MPILSTKDSMNFVPIDESRSLAPSFYETMAAGFQFTVDEGLSISSDLNRQAWYDRRTQLEGLYEDGFDVGPYIQDDGKIDYNGIADATGLLKSDTQLAEERNNILAERRRANEDVLERGNGLAQFFGMAGGYMLDPINIATLPIGVVGAAKGIGTVAAALRGAGTQGAIAVASEAAIQPFVYKHKLEIGSPYDTQDAIEAIAYAAGGAAIIGGVLGGVSGYLRTLADKSEIEIDQVLREAQGAELRSATFTPKFEKLIITKPTDDPLTVITARLKQEANQSLGTPGVKGARQRLHKAKYDLKMHVKRKPVPKKVISDIADIPEFGKKPLSQSVSELDLHAINRYEDGKQFLSRKLQEAEADLEKLKRANRSKEEVNQIAKGRMPNRVKKEIDEMEINSTPETQSISMLRRYADDLRAQKGFRVEEVPLKGLEDALATGPVKNAVPAMVKAIDDTLKKLDTSTPENQVKSNDLLALRERIVADETDGRNIVSQIVRENNEKDLAIMAANESALKEMNSYYVKPEDFIGPAKPDSPKAPATNLERQVLDDDGMGKYFDEEVAAYNRLESKQIFDENGNIVDADKVIQELNDDLDGLDSIMRCSIG